MEKCIKTTNRRKRRTKNPNKLRSKLNLAINHIVNNKNKVCIEYPLSHKNAVLSKTASRFINFTQSENNIKIFNDYHNAKEQQVNNEQTFNKIVWNIPFSNGKGNLDTVVTIQPCQYPNKLETCKALMNIIASYINESFPDYTMDYCPKKINSCQNIVSNLKYLEHKDKSKEKFVDNLSNQQAGFNTNNPSPATIAEEASTCSEDESPCHIYYPHRLHQ